MKQFPVLKQMILCRLGGHLPIGDIRQRFKLFPNVELFAGRRFSSQQHPVDITEQSDSIIETNELVFVYDIVSQ